MKLTRILQLTASISMLSAAMLAQAHSPFVAPQAYIVDGNTATVLGGYAEAPFAAEFALSGFALSVTHPTGEVQPLEVKGTKYLTAADVETKAEGTYKVTGTRENALEFAQVNGKWLRVMENHGDTLPPLAERSFITPAEVTKKMKTAKSVRYEQLVGFFSKAKVTNDVLKSTAQGLDVHFSQHPNSLTANQAVNLTVTLNGKAQQGYSVVVLKELATAGEEEFELEQTTNTQGQVQLNLPKAGQYIVEINPPEVSEKVQPAAQSFRQNIAIRVN